MSFNSSSSSSSEPIGFRLCSSDGSCYSFDSSPRSAFTYSRCLYSKAKNRSDCFTKPSIVENAWKNENNNIEFIDLKVDDNNTTLDLLYHTGNINAPTFKTAYVVGKQNIKIILDEVVDTKYQVKRVNACADMLRPNYNDMFLEYYERGSILDFDYTSVNLQFDLTKPLIMVLTETYHVGSHGDKHFEQCHQTWFFQHLTSHRLSMNARLEAMPPVHIEKVVESLMNGTKSPIITEYKPRPPDSIKPRYQSPRIGPHLVNKLATQEGGGKTYKVRVDKSTGTKYIMCKKKKVLLSVIRGKYRYTPDRLYIFLVGHLTI